MRSSRMTLSWPPVVLFLTVSLSVASASVAPAGTQRAATTTSTSTSFGAVDESELVADPDFLGWANEELAKDEGVPVTAVERGVSLLPEVHQLLAFLNSQGPTSFGGMYIEWNPSFHVTVLASPGARSEVVQSVDASGLYSKLSPFVSVKASEYTEAVLRKAVDAVYGLDFDEVYAAYPDLTHGRVVVQTTTSAAAESLGVRLEAADLPIPASRVYVEPVEAAVPAANSFGGLNAVSSQNCTTGFSVRQTDGGNADGVTDAAHCPNNGVYVQAQLVTWRDSAWGGDQDVQWFTTPGMEDQNKIRNDVGTTKDITDKRSRANMAEGDPLCHYGVPGGKGCGTIETTSYPYDPNNGRNYNNTFILVKNDSVVEGDSGGPVYHNQIALGTLVARLGSDKYVFMAQNFMGVLNITPKTSP